jgi:hypothetical protein
MDEFQDIFDLKDSHEALAMFRSHIQHQPQIPYVFIGSIRHKMAGIFMDNKSPFFKSAIPLEVGRINPDEFSLFIKKNLKLARGPSKTIPFPKYVTIVSSRCVGWVECSETQHWPIFHSPQPTVLSTCVGFQFFPAPHVSEYLPCRTNL